MQLGRPSIRTPDLLLRRQLLYPVELRADRTIAKVYAMAHPPPSGPERHRTHQAWSGLQRDNHSALLTTLTLLSAMAAPASMGLSPPKAASGMPMTL